MTAGDVTECQSPSLVSPGGVEHPAPATQHRRVDVAESGVQRRHRLLRGIAVPATDLVHPRVAALESLQRFDVLAGQDELGDLPPRIYSLKHLPQGGRPGAGHTTAAFPEPRHP